MSKVFFVGAGPGAADLITVRGKSLIENADVIIYAGSLVNPELLEFAKKDCEIWNSAYMTLEQVIETVKTAVFNGKSVVRLHTGDPSIYGTVREQAGLLSDAGISYEICPGVSSFCAAAASMKTEYTLPGVSQTVILTRAAGKTNVPEIESIRSLSAHKSSMILFLSAGQLEHVSEELIKGGYPPETEAAIVYKASWKDEKIVRCTVAELAEKAFENGIVKTALVCVGKFLGNGYELSRLYSPDFSTEYRKAKT